MSRLKRANGGQFSGQAGGAGRSCIPEEGLGRWPQGKEGLLRLRAGPEALDAGDRPKSRNARPSETSPGAPPDAGRSPGPHGGSRSHWCRPIPPPCSPPDGKGRNNGRSRSARSPDDRPCGPPPASSGGRREGRGRRTGRSSSRRSAGTAEVSVWSLALTSSHQSRADVLAWARSGKGPWATRRSDLAYPTKCSTVPLLSGPGRFAEVGSETVVGGEAQVVGMRHDQPGDRSGAQTPHAVGEKHRRDAADLLRDTRPREQGWSPDARWWRSARNGSG